MITSKQIIHGKSFDEETGKSSGVEIIQTEQTSPPPEEVTIDPQIERRLVRKLDLRLMIWAFLAYFANLLDRNNMRKCSQHGYYLISLFICVLHEENAFTNGMEEDLDLNSDAYNWAVTMFFIGYIM